MGYEEDKPDALMEWFRNIPYNETRTEDTNELVNLLDIMTENTNGQTFIPVDSSRVRAAREQNSP